MPKDRLLLLLPRSGHRLSRDVVLDTLWPDADGFPRSADRFLKEAVLTFRLVGSFVSVRPLEEISLNFAKSLDPDHPGVQPGGGDLEP